jgi:5-methylcytosine-specific restriction endonuclease McrA
MPKAPPIHRQAAPQVRKHNPRGKAPADRQRTRAMHTGSKGWRLLRLSVLQRDGYTCAVCGKYGDQVDHVDGDSHNNQPENLQVLCRRDHSAKTMREVNGKR